MVNEKLEFGSVCSGIESASVACEPLGITAAWFSEISHFPNMILAERWPDVPNLGDMTQIASKIRNGEIPAPIGLIGGTPCQAFSVAGEQKSLDDDRGQLTLTFGEILNEIDNARRSNGEGEAFCLWENVPGVLRTKDNAFGWFLGLLAGEFSLADLSSGKARPLTFGNQPEKKKSNIGWKWDSKTNSHRAVWPVAGCVIGPKRTVAWRVLDAQYFGLAQRRKRVFVVASARKGFDPAKVLFEQEGVRRDSAPSRGPREENSNNVGGSIKSPSHWDDPNSPHPTLSQSFNTGGIGASNQEIFSQRGSGLTPTICMAHGQANAEINTEICPTLTVLHEAPIACIHGSQDPIVSYDIAHCLGRNNGQENAVAFAENSRGELRFESGHGQTSCCLTTGGGKAGQGIPHICYGIPGNWIGRLPENGGNSVKPMLNISPCQTATDRHGVVYASYARRLIPLECERLQGFDDGYTNISWYKCKCGNEYPQRYGAFGCNKCDGGKEARLVSAPDGARYAALGNSKAVPVVRWIAERILMELKK